jgi:hypothetical protein
VVLPSGLQYKASELLERWSSLQACAYRLSAARELFNVYLPWRSLTCRNAGCQAGERTAPSRLYALPLSL